MFKFAYKLFVFALIGFLVLGVFGLFKIKREVGSLDPDVVKEYYIAALKNDLNAKEKAIMKGQIRNAKDKVYEEATEHNPEGDMLPDEIDDNLKARIKEEIK